MNTTLSRFLFAACFSLIAVISMLIVSAGSSFAQHRVRLGDLVSIGPL